VNLSRKDEIGELAASFDSMVQRINARTQELEALNDMTATVGKSLDLQEILQRAVEKVCWLNRTEGAVIHLLDNRTDQLVLAGSYGIFPPILEGLIPFKPGQSVADWFAETGELFLEVENTATDPRAETGLEVWKSLVVVPLRSAGKMVGTLGTGNITQRRFTPEEVALLQAIGNQLEVAIENARLHTEMQRYAEEMSDIYHNAACGYHSLGPDGTFQRINNTELKWLGYTSDEIIGKKKFTDVITPDSLQIFQSNFPELKKRGWIGNIEYDMIRKNGTILPVLLNATAIMGREGRFIASRSSVVDNTERKQAEEALRKTKDLLLQSEKLAAIGQLAAGVTHEILNPVNIISLELQLLQKMETLSPKVNKELTVCMEQVKRIVTIAENLNRFSRIHSRKRLMTDINAVIDRVVTLYMPQLKMDGVQIDIRYQSDLPATLANAEMIEQVILNVITNAVAAMEGKKQKVMRIATSRNTVIGRHDYLRVMIADNGTGITEKNLIRLFEPFFTTKESGKGTGLGLSISYGIIEDHGGRIWAENNTWGGASFFFDLPVIPNSDNKSVEGRSDI